jgi:uncharacterized damage-inducible protein DinB
MSLQKLTTNYASFNLWANQTLIEWIKTKPSEVLDKEVASSFPSIIKTIIHIWDTERFWLCILKGVPPPNSFRRMEFEGTADEAMEGLLNESRNFAAYVNTLSENDMLEKCYLDTPWVKGELPKYEFIQHAMNHSTYHRGQVITIGRNVGLTDAPMTDYNYYNMMNLKKVPVEA